MEVFETEDDDIENPFNKIEPKILLDLLLLQNVLWSLPGENKMIEAILYALKNIPGIESIKYIKFDTSKFRISRDNVLKKEIGGFKPEFKENYKVEEKDDNINGNTKNSKIFEIPIKTLHNYFGNIVIELNNPKKFTNYKPFIENICSFVSLLIENLIQRNILEDEKHYLREQRLKSIGTLADGIAHDFNNILSVILGYSEMISMENSLNELNQERINEILKAAFRAKNLIKKILIFSKAGSGKPEIFVPHEIIKETVEMMRATIPKTTEIIMDLCEEQNPLNGEIIEFQQMLMNLITNSYQSFEMKKGTINISLKLEYITKKEVEKVVGMDEGLYYMLIVNDNGPGIPDSILDQIFNPFFTTKSEGTGLGLPIVYGIVKKYNGDINVISEVGTGTTFKIYLPIKDIKTAINSPILTNKKLINLLEFRGSGNLIIIDDELSFLEYMDHILSSIGYNVIYFDNVDKFLNLLNKDEFYADLIITDFNMPKINGIELGMKIKEKNENIKIILISGSSLRVLKKVEKIFTSNLDEIFYEIIFKPIESIKLVKKISEILKDI